MGRPKANDARDTRRAILDAALDLFAESGFHATSIRALASAVGVRESALYHHFASKDLILEAVIEERVQVRTEKIEKQMAKLGSQSLAETLTDMAEEIVGIMQSPVERKFMRIAMSLGPAAGVDSSPFQRFSEKPRRMVGAMLAELQRSGRMRKDVDLEVFMLHFVAPLFIVSGVMWGGVHPKVIKMPMSQFIKAHVAFVLRAVS